MPKLVSAPFSVFKRVLRSRNQDVVFVLHKPGCSDCREFIQNPYLSMQKITSYGADDKPDHIFELSDDKREHFWNLLSQVSFYE